MVCHRRVDVDPGRGADQIPDDPGIIRPLMASSFLISSRYGVFGKIPHFSAWSWRIRVEVVTRELAKAGGRPPLQYTCVRYQVRFTAKVPCKHAPGHALGFATHTFPIRYLLGHAYPQRLGYALGRILGGPEVFFAWDCTALWKPETLEPEIGCFRMEPGCRALHPRGISRIFRCSLCVLGLGCFLCPFSFF